MAICECGCGKEFERVRKKGAPIRFIPGHQFRRPETRAAYFAGKTRQRAIPPADYPTHGLCECGCGQKTAIATISSRKAGRFKGLPYRFIRGHNPHKRGAESPFFKGIRHSARGYILVYRPDHPHAYKKGSNVGYIFEHRIVWEAANGRFLEPHEIIHHVNHDRADNRIENLMLVSKSQHRRLHQPYDRLTEETRRRLSEGTRRAWAEGRMRH